MTVIVGRTNQEVVLFAELKQSYPVAGMSGGRRKRQWPQ